MKYPIKALEGKRIVFVIGGPGCGKGTQCDKIVEKYGFTHLSTGDLLREAVKSENDVSKKATEIMKSGKLVPMEIVLEMLKEAILAKAPESKGFLIDGYPRDLKQGQCFEEQICPVECVLYFAVKDETMKSRLMKRAETSGRADDNEETIVKRLATFHEHSEPVVKYYKEKGKLNQIDAEGNVNGIFEEVVKILG